MTTGADPRGVVRAVQAALESSPAYQRLDPHTRAELAGSLAHVSDYMGGQSSARAFAEGDPAGGVPPPEGGTGSPTARVGEVARATLGAIDFPSFVSALIKGTFQAIVDATIQQMEAYSTLLKEVAKTVDDYMEDNVTEDAAKDYLVDRYSGVFTKDTTGGTATLDVDRSNPTGTLPSFLQNLGFDNAAQIDPNSVDEVIVPAARKTMAEQRHQTLATMVLLGLNRIVVEDGEINAKLEFSIDAVETTDITFDSTQTSMGNMAGMSGQATFSGNGIMVNTTNINAQSDLTVRADLTGEVRVHFRSDVLPLERFADSNAIQLINQHATVPQARALPEDTAAEEGDTDAGAEAQSLAAALPPPYDPWSPS